MRFVKESVNPNTFRELFHSDRSRAVNVNVAKHSCRFRRGQRRFFNFR